MKRTIISVTILIVSIISISSQTVHSMYFMDKWSQRSSYNASFAPEYGYFALPVLGGIDLGFSSNVGLSNFTYPYNSELYTFLHQKPADRAVDPGLTLLDALNPVSSIRQSLNLNLLSLGIYLKDNSFISFNVSMKENLNMNLPKDLFRFMKLGMVNSTNNTYDLKNLGFDLTGFTQVGVGYSRDINSQIRVGATVKMLLGQFSERINYSQFDVSLAQDQYQIKTTGESLMMSDLISFGKDANNYYDLSQFKVDPSKLKTSGFGFAFDLGVTYKPIDKLTLAASINDLGSISWNKSLIKKGIATSDVSFSGFSNIDIANLNVQSQLDSLINSMSNLVKFKDTSISSNISESIPSNINISAEYSIFGNKNQDITVGLLFQNYNAKSYSVNELVGAITLKPLSWIAISGTCEFLRKDANRFGLALNLSPKWVNFYIASDFIAPKVNKQFIPINGTGFNMSIGLSTNLGKPKD